MRILPVVSVAAISLMASVGVSAAEQGTSGKNAEFSTLRAVKVTPMNHSEMQKVRGTFNLFMYQDGSTTLIGTFSGNFQHTPGYNNVILGCGGGPQPTSFSSPGC